jgi:hypothetical protein
LDQETFHQKSYFYQQLREILLAEGLELSPNKVRRKSTLQ